MLYDNAGVLWRIPVSALLGFLILLLLLRISGKRTVAQFNMYDMILTFTVGSVLSSFIILENVKFLDAAVALASIIAVDYLISFGAMRSHQVRRFVKAEPTLLVYNGEMIDENMRHERIVEDEVMMFMRQNGVDRLSHVKAMVLESTGTVSVFSDEGQGHDVRKALERSGVDVAKHRD